MTDEQIRQRAEKYAKQFLEPYDEEYAPIKYTTAQMAHIAGAHSRDEEIELLQHALSQAANMLRNGDDKLLADYMAQKIELNQLRNPWISVEDRLPKEGQPLVVENKSGNRYYCYYNASIEEFLTIAPDGELWNVCEVTHWMPIPELK